MPAIMINWGEGDSIGLPLTLSIPGFSCSLLCLYNLVSLYLTVSPYLCGFLCVVCFSNPYFCVLPLYHNSILADLHKHTYTYCHNTYHLGLGGTNSNTKSPFLSMLLDMALKCEFSQSLVESRKTDSYTFQICLAEPFAPAY